MGAGQGQLLGGEGGRGKGMIHSAMGWGGVCMRPRRSGSACKLVGALLPWPLKLLALVWRCVCVCMLELCMCAAVALCWRRVGATYELTQLLRVLCPWFGDACVVTMRTCELVSSAAGNHTCGQAVTHTSTHVGDMVSW